METQNFQNYRTQQTVETAGQQVTTRFTVLSILHDFGCDNYFFSNSRESSMEMQENNQTTDSCELCNMVQDNELSIQIESRHQNIVIFLKSQRHIVSHK